MRRPIAVLAGIATGVAAVSLAAGTGFLPNPLAQDKKQVAEASVEPTIQTIEAEPEAAAVITVADQTSEHRANEAVSSPRASDLAARLEEAETREAALKAEKQRLEDQVAQLAALEKSLREQTDTLTAKSDALTERQAFVESREADLDAREEDLAVRLSEIAEAAPPAPRISSADETAQDLPQDASDGGAASDNSDDADPVRETADSGAAVPVESSEKTYRTFSDGPIAEVHFELNSAELTPGGQLRAQQAAERVSKMKVAKIRIVGLTDRSGSDRYNDALSKARAEAVASVFVQSGLSRRVIEVVGMGETHYMLPISTGDGVSEPLNRCVGILVEEAVPL